MSGVSAQVAEVMRYQEIEKSLTKFLGSQRFHFAINN
jgi:hypothetical protein